MLQIADQPLPVWQTGDRIGEAGCVPRLKKGDHQVRQQPQCLQLLRAERMRLSISHTEGTKDNTFAIFQWHAGVKADPRRTGYKAMRNKPGIKPGIRYDHRAVVINHVAAERLFARGLFQRKIACRADILIALIQH